MPVIQSPEEEARAPVSNHPNTAQRKVIIKGWKREKTQSHEDAALAPFPLVRTCGGGEAGWRGYVCFWVCRGWGRAVRFAPVRRQFRADGLGRGRPSRHQVGGGAVDDGDVSDRLLPQGFLIIFVNEHDLGLDCTVKAEQPPALTCVLNVLVAKEYHGDRVLRAGLGHGAELTALIGWWTWLGCNGSRGKGHHAQPGFPLEGDLGWWTGRNGWWGTGGGWQIVNISRRNVSLTWNWGHRHLTPPTVSSSSCMWRPGSSLD